MDQPFDTIFDTGERSKWGNLGNGTGDDLTRSVALLHRCPRIHLGPLDGQGNLLLIFIDAEHLHFDLLANMQDFAGMIDAAPSELTDMHQSVCSSQIDKGPEISEIAHHASSYLTGPQFIEQFFTPSLPPFLHRQALRKN